MLHVRKVAIDKDVEVTTTNLAGIIGVTKQWVNQLTRDGVLKQASRGKYLLGDSVKAFIEHTQGGKEEDNKPRFIDEKTEHERIKKEIAMLELEEKRSNLHTTADVVDAWGELLVGFRTRLSSLPPKLATELSQMTDQKSIRLLLERNINAALQELANYDPLADENS